MKDNNQQFNEQELAQIAERAEQLSEEELYELVTVCGISFAGIESKEQAREITKDQYISVLDEADDKEKIYKFLNEHGV